MRLTTLVVAGLLIGGSVSCGQFETARYTDITWMINAADSGDARAQQSLGFSYDHGLDVPKDDAEAVRWYRLAAEQGFAMAQVNLGMMYSAGKGVPKDDIKAVRWLRRSRREVVQRGAARKA
jgi:hypothetical protein